jgi:hypothetical protein
MSDPNDNDILDISQPRKRIFAAALLLALLATVWFFFARRSTTTAVAQQNRLDLYHDSPAEQLHSPFHLRIDPMERLLLINFTEEPDEIYIGFEPQIFDDAVHGQGMLVIGWRVDGRVDVYHQPSLTLDPDTYDIAGAGLAEMAVRPLSDAYFNVTDAGVDAYFAFEDVLGRPIEVTIQENGQRPRQPFGLLAPMGGAATAPSVLPLVILHDFYFVRRADTTVSVKVNGQERRLDNLPMPIDGSRMYFTRYSPDVMIGGFNPAHNGPLTPLERISPTEARAGDLIYDLADNHGRTEIVQMRRAFNGRELTAAFNPPLPNLLNLADGAATSGQFSISADPSVGVVTGEYWLERPGDTVAARLIPSGGWQHNESKWAVRFIYAVAPDFRNWPKTYLWTADIAIANPEQVVMQSGWQRTNE